MSEEMNDLIAALRRPIFVYTMAERQIDLNHEDEFAQSRIRKSANTRLKNAEHEINKIVAKYVRSSLGMS